MRHVVHNPRAQTSKDPVLGHLRHGDALCSVPPISLSSFVLSIATSAGFSVSNTHSPTPSYMAKYPWIFRTANIDFAILFFSYVYSRGQTGFQDEYIGHFFSRRRESPVGPMSDTVSPNGREGTINSVLSPACWLFPTAKRE